MTAEDIKDREKEWQNTHGASLLKQSFSFPGTRAVLEYQYDKIINALMPVVGEGKKVLEVGCGIGNFLQRLSKHCPQLDLVGIDISANTLEEARKNVHGKVELLLADGEMLPFGDSQFDGIIYEGVVHHFPDFQQALSQAYRVLAPNGKIVVYEPISTLFTRFIRHLFGITGKNISDIESPVDLSLKDRFTKKSLLEVIKNIGYKIEVAHCCDFLAYPLTGGYKPTVFSRSERLMNRLLLFEQRLQSVGFVRSAAQLLCWRVFIVLSK